MSRMAADAGFERFVRETIDATRRAFSVERALDGTGLGPGGAIIDRLRSETEAIERQLVDPEFARYRQDSIEQFRVVLDYAESDEPIEAFEDALLAHDSYAQAIDPDVPAERREAVRTDLLDRLQRLGDGVVPIVERPEDEFWPAMTAAFDRETALDLVEHTFAFTGPLCRHRDVLVFAVDIDPGEVLGGPLADRLPSASIDYTEEAIRAMCQAEQQVIAETKTELDERFDAVA
jgi:hypothetical protein